MQIYLGGYFLYGFDQQLTFRDKYIFRNLSAKREYRKYNENNIEHKSNMLQKTNRKPDCLLALIGKGIKYVYVLLFCDEC